MNKKATLCWHCNKYPATMVDYRTFNDCTGKYASCEWCRNLDNKTIRKIQEKKLDPKSFYRKEEKNGM